MAFDALRGYVQLANGLTEVTRQRALLAAKQLVDQGGEVVEQAVSTVGAGSVARQAQTLAEDLLATSRTNRDLLVGLVRTEVERAVARMGLVGADELAAMIRVVDRLQNQLDAAIAFGGADKPKDDQQGNDDRPPTTAATKKAPGTKVPATKVPAKKVPAKKVPANKVPAKKAPAKEAPATKAPAKKAPAKKAPAKKAPAKKAPAKKAPGGPA